MHIDSENDREVVFKLVFGISEIFSSRRFYVRTVNLIPLLSAGRRS